VDTPRLRAWQVPCPGCAHPRNPADYYAARNSGDTVAALLRSWGRPSPLHENGCKGSALPLAPTERAGRRPSQVLPGLCGPEVTVAYFTHRIVTARLDCRTKSGALLRTLPVTLPGVHRSLRQHLSASNTSHRPGLTAREVRRQWEAWAGVGGVAPRGSLRGQCRMGPETQNISLDIRRTWHRLLIGGQRKAEG